MGSEGKGSWRSPRGFANPHDIKTLEYLAFISDKYEVDFEKFFNSIVRAWNQESSACGDLRIKCRGKLLDQNVFLITNHGKVVAQFQLDEHLLRERDLLRDVKPDMQLHFRSWKKYRETHS